MHIKRLLQQYSATDSQLNIKGKEQPVLFVFRQQNGNSFYLLLLSVLCVLFCSAAHPHKHFLLGTIFFRGHGFIVARQAVRMIRCLKQEQNNENEERDVPRPENIQSDSEE